LPVFPLSTCENCLKALLILREHGNGLCVRVIFYSLWVLVFRFVRRDRVRGRDRVRKAGGKRLKLARHAAAFRVLIKRIAVI
jgi:hypothetical protein